jgi:hypothetical protein
LHVEAVRVVRVVQAEEAFDRKPLRVGEHRYSLVYVVLQQGRRQQKAGHVEDMLDEPDQAAVECHKAGEAYVEGGVYCVSCTIPGDQIDHRLVVERTGLPAYHQGQHQRDPHFLWRMQKLLDRQSAR